MHTTINFILSTAAEDGHKVTTHVTYDPSNLNFYQNKTFPSGLTSTSSCIKLERARWTFSGVPECSGSKFKAIIPLLHFPSNSDAFFCLANSVERRHSSLNGQNVVSNKQFIAMKTCTEWLKRRGFTVDKMDV